MSAQTTTKEIQTGSPGKITRQQWIGIALVTGAAAVVAVLIVQALALAIWPQAVAFRPLESYPRSALFTLIPALIATGLFAWLHKNTKDPVASFIRVAVVVLLLSFIPDYLLPDPNKTLLASSIAAFLHIVAGVITTLGILTGYRQVMKRKA